MLFNVEGIVIKIFIDVNGMQYIGFYLILDCFGLWCYFSIILLLLMMLGSVIYNGV